MGASEVALPATTIALPAHIFEDHIMGQSLFSISDITKQDYSATFHKNGLYIYHDDDLVHFSPKTTAATVWTLPIQCPLEHANAVISLPSDKKFVEFTNASLGSPVQSTLLRAVRRGYLSTMPRLTSELLCKHPSNTVATAMGHLDRTRQGLDSTKSVPASPAQPVDTYDTDIAAIPDKTGIIIDNDQNVYTMLIATADFDSTSRFPVPSAGEKYIYHLVSCFNDNIHVEPMQSRTSGSYFQAYAKTFDHWARYGPVPSIVRLDNETSVELETFLLEVKQVKTFQYFPQGNHRANRAERCIRTWKNHFTATLATTSPKFPNLHITASYLGSLTPTYLLIMALPDQSSTSAHIL